MKYNLFIVGLLFSFCILSGCGEEPMYREADIESITFADSVFVNYVVGETEVIAFVRKNTDMTNLVPIITLSPKATCVPASGIAQNFTSSVKYTVTSEDGAYTKSYDVIVQEIDTILIYNFEDWGTAGGVWNYPALKDITWQSANPGIAMALGQRDAYPTRPTADGEGLGGGKAALMETLRGKSVFGRNIAIFSGSFFRGKFKLNSGNVLLSTRFGQIHPKECGKPKTFSGYYKYTPGPYFIQPKGSDGVDTLFSEVDDFSIYASLYRVSKGIKGVEESLDGTNILDVNSGVIAKAEMQKTQRIPQPNFTKFSLDFVYTEEMDYNTYNYKLALVFASSRDGDNYRGAPGSTLVVDSVVVECVPFAE